MTTIQLLAAKQDTALTARLEATAASAGITNAAYTIQTQIVAILSARLTGADSLTTVYAAAIRARIETHQRELYASAGVTVAAGGDIEYGIVTAATWQVDNAASPSALIDLYRAAGGSGDPGWSAAITDEMLAEAVASVAQPPAAE